MVSGSDAGSGWRAGRHMDIEASWRALSESVRDSADGFAATDPRNGTYYQRDAELFCDRMPPLDDEEALDRYAEAAGLRERWAARFTSRRVRRKPR